MAEEKTVTLVLSAEKVSTVFSGGIVAREYLKRRDRGEPQFANDVEDAELLARLVFAIATDLYRSIDSDGGIKDKAIEEINEILEKHLPVPDSLIAALSTHECKTCKASGDCELEPLKEQIVALYEKQHGGEL